MSGVVHVVLFRFRPEVDAHQRQEVERRFRALQDSERDGRRYIRSIVSGPQASPEGHGRGFELGFVVGFDSVDDRDHYLGPPHSATGDAAHAAFTRFVGPLLAEDGVLVWDLLDDR